VLVAIGDEPHHLEHLSFPGTWPAAAVGEAGQDESDELLDALHGVGGLVLAVELHDVLQLLEHVRVYGDLHGYLRRRGVAIAMIAAYRGRRVD